jgi:hypothetical protein
MNPFKILCHLQNQVAQILIEANQSTSNDICPFFHLSFNQFFVINQAKLVNLNSEVPTLSQ